METTLLGERTMCGRIIERLVSSKGKLNLIRAFVCTCECGIRDRVVNSKVVAPASTNTQMFMSDEEVVRILDEEYGERGFEDLPDWLQQELLARQLTWQPREPTEYEKQTTYSDWREHRITHNELSITDLITLMKEGTLPW